MVYTEVAMITSIWYHIEDNRPTKTGYYLAYKKPSLGDDSEGYGVYYWDNEYTDWRESAAPHSYGMRVTLWSELPAHDPYDSTTHAPTIAEVDAWNNVVDAIDKFNMIKELGR
jgi:hypothetical protein